MTSKICSSSADAFFTRSRTRPSDERSSKMTTRITRWATSEMWMLSLLPLVEEDRELLLADQLGQPVGGGDVAGGQRGERGRVDAAHVAVDGDLLAVLVDQEDDLGVGVDLQTLEVSLICWYSSSYITRSGDAICVFTNVDREDWDGRNVAQVSDAAAVALRSRAALPAPWPS